MIDLPRLGWRAKVQDRRMCELSGYLVHQALSARMSLTNVHLSFQDISKLPHFQYTSSKEFRTQDWRERLIDMHSNEVSSKA